MKISPLRLTNFREFVKAKKIYVPMKDSSDLMGQELSETIARAKFAANEVIETIMGGGNALVTCKAGWNRSGLISGLALKKLTDASPRRIISSIRKNRSIFALSNPLFVEITKRG